MLVFTKYSSVKISQSKPVLFFLVLISFRIVFFYFARILIILIGIREENIEKLPLFLLISSSWSLIEMVRRFFANIRGEYTFV